MYDWGNFILFYFFPCLVVFLSLSLSLSLNRKWKLQLKCNEKGEKKCNSNHFDTLLAYFNTSPHHQHRFLSPPPLHSLVIPVHRRPTPYAQTVAGYRSSHGPFLIFNLCSLHFYVPLNGSHHHHHHPRRSQVLFIQFLTFILFFFF